MDGKSKLDLVHRDRLKPAYVRDGEVPKRAWYRTRKDNLYEDASMEEIRRQDESGPQSNPDPMSPKPKASHKPPNASCDESYDAETPVSDHRRDCS
ncbi:hypothetical protein BG011_003568, partial [Mortierella polycephala]